MARDVQAKTETDNSPLAVSVEEAARRLGIGRSAVFALIASGELRSFRVGRRRLLELGALADFVREQVARGEG